uniref:Uncharacterized protein n=1 Tax=Knipowitschia caucasica TaxID=637954 RepID=A0AAV2LZA5_KNICA
MRCGVGPWAIAVALSWTLILNGVQAKKERKKLKEGAPQNTENFNATVSNSEEVEGTVKAVCFAFSPPIELAFSPLPVYQHCKNSRPQ